MHYDDMTIEASEFTTRTEDDRRLGTFKVRALESPAGEMSPGEAVTVEYDDKDLQSSLAKLERRELDAAGLMAVGRALAALLLPVAAQGNAPSVRELFARSLVGVGPDDGLRLRLRLPADLAVIPWEYAYVERAGGEGMDGFIALDPRVAIVRHEVLALALTAPLLTGDIKVITAFAAAEGLPDLNLDDEMKFLNEALSGLEGLHLEPCQHATLKKLQPLLPGAGVFHFAGHGDFTRKMGARPGTYTGVGYLAFEDESVDAEQMGINLHGNGVRLTVLAGCHTGRRDGISVWSGIAPALVKAEIPAVVANQYTILDKCAIAFSHQFYQALAGGLPIERAVSAGRIATYNADKGGRDWGVPVLYLRASDGQLFAGAANPQVRERCKQDAEADVTVRAAEIRAGGVLVGADVTRMLKGKLGVAVNISGTVFGKVTGFESTSVEGGSLQARVDVKEVGSGGRVTGVKIDTLGGTGSTLEKTRALDPEESRTAPPSSTSVSVGNVGGGQVIGTQISERGGDTVHGDRVEFAAGGQATINRGIGGENVQISSVTIYQGTNAQPGKPEEDVVEEKLRLDVALPKTAVVDEPFDLVVQVRQPEAPTLTVTDLDHVVSAEGSIFRNEKSELVKYRVEVTGAGFQVVPANFLLKLRPRENSRVITFQIVASKLGKRALFVNAYEEDGALAAQTRLSIEVGVTVRPY